MRRGRRTPRGVRRPADGPRRLPSTDRFVLGLTTLFARPLPVAKLGAILKPATLLRFPRAPVDRKYRRPFVSIGTPTKPGPKGPSKEPVAAIIDIRRCNPGLRYQRIAEQNANTFGIDVDRAIVRRVLARRVSSGYSDSLDASSLTLLAHTKDSLGRVELFRCQSILFHGHWVLLLIDVLTRLIVGFGIDGEFIDGMTVCRMFTRAIAGTVLPKWISTDRDPLPRFRRWLASQRILDIEEIQSAPYASTPHPFGEHPIGATQRECQDRTFYWSSIYLEREFKVFRSCCSWARDHRAPNGTTPAHRTGSRSPSSAQFAGYVWKSHHLGLFETLFAT